MGAVAVVYFLATAALALCFSVQSNFDQSANCLSVGKRRLIQSSSHSGAAFVTAAAADLVFKKQGKQGDFRRKQGSFSTKIR